MVVSPKVKVVIKVLMLGDGLGFARTNPKKFILDDRSSINGFKLFYNYHPNNACGSQDMECMGDQKLSQGITRTGRADKDAIWWFADNSPSGIPAGSFGYYYKVLEDYNELPSGKYFFDIEVYFNTSKIKDVIKYGNYDVCITGSKGIRPLVRGAVASDRAVSLVLINGASRMINGNILPSNSKITSIILTDGGNDPGRVATPNEIDTFLNGNDIPTFIYINDNDGHNPRSLAFPSDISNFINCNTALPSGGFEGTNRIPGRNSYLVDLVKAVYHAKLQKLLGVNDWAQLTRYLKSDPQSSKSDAFSFWKDAVKGSSPTGFDSVPRLTIQVGGKPQTYGFITDPSDNTKYLLSSEKGQEILQKYMEELKKA